MSIPLDTRADGRVAPTDRAAAVLRTLNQALGGMAAGIPEPKLAGPLGYFADAAAWAGHCLESDERMHANEKVIGELVAEAHAVLEQTEAAPPIGHQDEVGAPSKRSCSHRHPTPAPRTCSTDCSRRWPTSKRDDRPPPKSLRASRARLER